MNIPESTDIAKYMPVTAIVDCYNEAKLDLERGYDLIQKANSKISSYAGGYGISNWKLREKDAADRDCLEMKKKVWQYIFQKVDIYNLISEKRREELDRQIEKGDLPEITVENIQSTVGGLLQNIGNLYKETVQETFDWLRPPRSRLKTNTEYEIGKKAIKEWVFDCDYGCRISYRSEQGLRGLDNAFHLMDGKGSVKYPGDVVTKINEAINHKQWGAETEYFKLKWYKVGTLHIDFNRLDLVEKMNAMAGGNRIKPSI